MEYEKGDLVRLSDFGKLLAGDMDCDIGMIVKGPYDLSVKTGDVVTTYYVAYDVLIGNEIMERVPTAFLKRMINDEEDIARVEKVDSGDKAD